MSDDDLIALLQGPSKVKDEFTAIHIQAKDARLAAKRIAALALQVQRARDDALEEAARVAEECYVSATLAPTLRIAAAIRALRWATEGAGG
jgi:hypothetical protein